MMPNRIEIGKVCEKGPHTDFAGNSDYGSCGNHYFGTIYLTVEQDRDGRGEPLPDLAHIVGAAFHDGTNCLCRYPQPVHPTSVPLYV